MPSRMINSISTSVIGSTCLMCTFGLFTYLLFPSEDLKFNMLLMDFADSGYIYLLRCLVLLGLMLGLSRVIECTPYYFKRFARQRTPLSDTQRNIVIVMALLAASLIVTLSKNTELLALLLGTAVYPVVLILAPRFIQWKIRCREEEEDVLKYFKS